MNQSVLSTCESIDGFRKKVAENDCNRLARTNHIYQLDTNSYNTVINDYVNKYTIFDSIDVVQIHPSAEHGYPHTRPDVICIPSNARFPSLQTTLFHEAIHIHQRRNASNWKRFLSKEQWTPMGNIPERWLERCRINPDTLMEPFWSYENRYVPLPMFINPYNPVFDQVKVMWYDMETGILEHAPPKSFISKYGNNRQSEHPYEIYAVIMESLGPISEYDINNYINA